MRRAQIYLKTAKALTLFWWFILSISTPTMDRVDFPGTSFCPRICVFLLQAVRVFSKNADVHNIISKWRRPWPFLWCDLSFQFQRPQWTGLDFSATSFYLPIKCVFPSSVCESFLKKCDVHNFISKWRRPWPFLWCDLSFQFQRPQWTGVDFQDTSFYSRIKCVFLLQSVRVFSKNADVHNFISNWRRPWSFLWGDLSFQFQCPQWTVDDFPATSFYPRIKCVLPSLVCESFLKKCWRAQFYHKMVKNWPDFFGDLSFQFQRTEWTGVDFPATSFYPWIKCVFLLQSVRVFSKNADVHNFISKWRRHWPFLWGAFILPNSTPIMDRVGFFSQFLLSADKMCFSCFSLWDFSLKMLTCYNFISKWRRPWPEIFGYLSFQFQCPPGTGLDFSATSFYLPIIYVFPSSVCESFLKKWWRPQFYLKMAKALTR